MYIFFIFSSSVLPSQRSCTLITACLLFPSIVVLVHTIHSTAHTKIIANVKLSQDPTPPVACSWKRTHGTQNAKQQHINPKDRSEFQTVITPNGRGRPFSISLSLIRLTHLAPHRSSLPALLPYRVTPDHPVADTRLLASWLMQTETGFSRNLQPHFCYRLLLPAMSFVQSSVEFERRCEFSKLRDGHAIDAQK